MSICLRCDAQEVEHGLPSFGEWDGGSVDSGWLEATLEEVNRDDNTEEEA